MKIGLKYCINITYSIGANLAYAKAVGGVKISKFSAWFVGFEFRLSGGWATNQQKAID
jgi:hypothetical protein